MLQTQAYEKLCGKGDARTYTLAAAVLKELGPASIVLLSNNPDKSTSLKKHGIHVTECRPVLLENYSTPHLERLRRDKMQQGHSMECTATYDLVVLGDINLDTCVKDLTKIRFRELVSNGVVQWEEIVENPGGTGLNFARYAADYGYTPFLLGKVGSDQAGKFLMDWIKRKGIGCGVATDMKAQTGHAVIIRDADNIRLLVDNAPNANQVLHLEDVSKYEAQIRAADIAYISGYSIRQRDSPLPGYQDIHADRR